MPALTFSASRASLSATELAAGVCWPRRAKASRQATAIEAIFFIATPPSQLRIAAQASLQSNIIRAGGLLHEKGTRAGSGGATARVAPANGSRRTVLWPDHRLRP